MSRLFKRILTRYAALVAAASAFAQPIPVDVAAAFQRARVPLDSVSLLITRADTTAPALLSHRAQTPMNPASAMKLVTTFAALELLGPNYTWRTPVWLDGKVNNGVLSGNLVIQGQGDPKLVVERVWLLLRRVQALGVRQIDGDLILDRSAFAPLPLDAAEFDGEPLRPYNATPDALLINFKSIVMTFTPDPANGVARIEYEPPLAGVQRPDTVPLAADPLAACGDYRAALKADFSAPQRIRFDGRYPLSCAEKVWPLAYSDPASFNARALAGLWQSMGGVLTGTVREGAAPATGATFEVLSPTLTELVRDINKFSNNVMAQQVFLTLGRATALTDNTISASKEAATQAVRQWWQQRIAADAPGGISTNSASWPPPDMDNGAGLSRRARITAASLGRLLQAAYASPLMPELMSSLPNVGVDGTLKRSLARPYSAHLKTGSLKDVLALAGYVHAADGQRYCLVALVNHPNARAAKPALDALVDWTAAQ